MILNDFFTFFRIICRTKRDHPLSTYAKLFEKLTILTPWYAHARMDLKIQGFKNVKFSTNVAYILNGWCQNRLHKTENRYNQQIWVIWESFFLSPQPVTVQKPWLNKTFSSVLLTTWQAVYLPQKGQTKINFFYKSVSIFKSSTNNISNSASFSL